MTATHQNAETSHQKHYAGQIYERILDKPAYFIVERGRKWHRERYEHLRGDYAKDFANKTNVFVTLIVFLEQIIFFNIKALRVLLLLKLVSL